MSKRAVLNADDIGRIAAEITSITSFDVTNGDPATDVVGRLLNVLQNEPIVKMATLWKIKRRSKMLCAKGRTVGVYNPDPALPENHSEFVCRYEGSEVERIIASAGFKNGAAHLIPDVEAFTDDIFFSAARKRGVKLRTAIALPIISHKRDQKYNPSYILMIYLDESVSPPSMNNYFGSILKAIANKASSTLSSQIEIRLKSITAFLQKTAATSPNLDDILKDFILRLVPENFSFVHSILIWRSATSRSFEIRLHMGRDPTRPTPIVAQKNLENMPLFCQRNIDSATVIFNSTIVEHFGLEFGAYQSAVLAPIKKHDPHERPFGYLILLDKLNPLALSVNKSAVILDQFDWEDELLMGHVTSMMSMLAELLDAEDRRKQLADQIAHEMVMPANYIVGTAEEVTEFYDDSTIMPDSRKKRHISNILTFARLQLALCDGILIGLRESGTPRAHKYTPERLDLHQLSRDVTRLTFPFCAQHGVRNDNIVSSRALPTIYADRAAFVQVFLNIITNSIKYKGDSKFDEFKVTINCEFVRMTSLPGDIQSQLVSGYHRIFDRSTVDPTLERGFLITFEDSGMGIAAGYEERIFQRHFRVPGVEQFAVRGTGLGLAIVRRIVADHYGAIWLDNRIGPTRFAMYLPEKIKNSSYTREQVWSEGGSLI